MVRCFPNMRLTFKHGLVTGILAAALAAAPAHAQSGTDKAAAEALFVAGRDLMNAGKFGEACSKLEASQRLDAGLGTLLYLADCYEKAGRLASAWATFREAESIAMGRSDQPRAEIARQRAAALEPRLPKLWIKVADGNAADTQVTRNGTAVPRESWGLALPVDAGDQTVQVSAPGKKPWSTTVRVEGEATNVAVDVPLLEAAPAAPEAPPGPPPGAPPPRQVEESSTGSTQKTIGLVVGGVGVVGVGLGTFFGLRAKSKKDSSLDHCPNDPNLCDAKGVDLRDQALGSAKLATAFMIGGGVLLAGGVVLFLTAPSGSPRTGTNGLQLAAGAMPGAAHVTLKGAF